MTTRTELTGAASIVAAPGTDPDALAVLVTWACGPRRDLDALRRRVRDGRARPGPDDVDLSTRPGAALVAEALEDGGPSGPPADVALRILRMWAGLGVRVCVVGDAAYPRPLAEGWPGLDGPTLLAWRGQPPATAGPGVAIVGSRNASAYGTAVAELLAASVSRAGGRVVSGGAVGIDAAAHAAAMGLPGGTTVVLGCGHAVGYPAAHARDGGLFDRILDDGGTVVSELLPEVAPHPGVIRARNRIVAGLSDLTVVVEGGGRSGALLTAGSAAERGREVLAVPGDILAPGSAAPLRLLAEGARACTGPQDVIALVPGLEQPPAGVAASSNAAGRSTLPAPVLQVLEQAGPRGVATEELVLAHGGSAGELVALLVRARVAGVVEEVAGGVRLRTTRPSVR